MRKDFRKKLQEERERIFGGTPPSQRNNDPFVAMGNALGGIGESLGLVGLLILQGWRRLTQKLR